MLALLLSSLGNRIRMLFWRKRTAMMGYGSISTRIESFASMHLFMIETDDDELFDLLLHKFNYNHTVTVPGKGLRQVYFDYRRQKRMAVERFVNGYLLSKSYHGDAFDASSFE